MGELRQVMVMVASIVLDPRLQMREKLDEQTIQHYFEIISEHGWIFPPIKMVNGFVVDGWHRLEAARRAGLKEVPAIVEEVHNENPYMYALLKAVGANSDHGLPRTNADKRRAVLTFLQSFPEETSAREVARVTRTSHTFVQNIIKSMQVTSEAPSIEAAKNQPASLPKKEKVMPVDAKPTEYYEDDLGNEVPESLYPIWRCKARILEICERVRSSSIHKDLDDLKALGVMLDSPSMENVADNIKELIQDAAIQIHDLQPSIVNGDGWFSIQQAKKEFEDVEIG